MTHRGMGGGIRKMGIDTKKKTWSGISGEIMFHLEQLHMTCLKRTQETSQETAHNLLPSEAVISGDGTWVWTHPGGGGRRRWPCWLPVPPCSTRLQPAVKGHPCRGRGDGADSVLRRGGPPWPVALPQVIISPVLTDLHLQCCRWKTKNSAFHISLVQ